MRFIATEVRPRRRTARHHVTTRRMSSPTGTSYIHMAGASLWPTEFDGEGREWGSITSRLQLRAVAIIQADENVLAVTCLEV